MSLTKKIMLPALIIAIAIAFTPVLNFAGLGADNAYADAKIAAPKSVKATAASTSAIKVTWKAVKGAKGYTVYQKKGSKFKAIKTTNKKAITVKKLKAGTKYTFYVKAYKKVGKKKVYSKASKKVSAKTKAAPVKENLTAVCQNGQFVGTKAESGVISYKGIPYAKAPVGDLRWKAPQAPDPSDAVIQANEFGHPSVQANYPLPDPAQNTVSWVFDGSKYQVSEDCLTLNVWTKDIDPAEKKPVMVWFHGGGFVVGSTTNDAYQFENFCNREDMIMVSVNYRLGIFGSTDMSAVPEKEGGTYKAADFKDSQNLALLDDIRALEWIQENIAAFGGDPSNVTIFGNSAGAADVTILTTANNEKIQNGELFQRVIAQSGGLALCVPDDGAAFTKERTDEIAKLMERASIVTGTEVTNLDELMAVPEDKLIEAYVGYPTNKGRLVDVNFFDPTGEEFIIGAALCYDNVYTPVFNDDAGLLPKDPYDLAAEGAGKNIDVMYGSNQNEWNYWIWEMAAFAPPADPANDPNPIPLIDEDYNAYTFGMMPMEKMAGLAATLTDEEMANNIQPFLALPRVAGLKQEAQERTDDQWRAIASSIMMMPPEAITDEQLADFKANGINAEENVWSNTEIHNDLVFRAPATKAAASHADANGTGKTYMYYWAKETDQKYQQAGHASEISYVTGNTNHTCFSGNVDVALSNQIQDMWANFARTGDPSANGIQWDPYDSKDRATMTMDLDNDGALKMVNDPLKEQRELIEPLLKYHLK